MRMFVENYNGYSQMQSVSNDLPQWVMNILFKPNMTFNKNVKVYDQVITQVNGLSAQEFAETVFDFKPLTSDKIELRNYIGSQIDMPSYSEYIAQLHDLNVKIALANYVMADKKQPLVNPYGAAYNQLQQKGAFICLAGPFSVYDKSRCIRDQYN